MQIQVLSDTHLEFWKHEWTKGIKFFREQCPSADMVILAGDIASFMGIEAALTEFTRLYQHVVYVPGNHDLWYGSFWEMKQIQKRCTETLSNLHWLNSCEGIVDINGIKIFGDTMWFPKPSEQIMGWATLYWPDFRFVQAYHQIFDEHQVFIDKLNSLSEKSVDIIITHHMPSDLSTPTRFEGKESNCFFMYDVEDHIDRIKPRYWIHGHTHDSCDYMLGDTRVIANPYGYHGQELNPEFNGSLVINL